MWVSFYHNGFIPTWYYWNSTLINYDQTDLKIMILILIKILKYIF